MSMQVVFYYFGFFMLFLRGAFFCPKSKLFLYPRLFLAVFILFQLTCYAIYHNYPGTHYLSSRCGEDIKLVKMVYFVLKTQGVLIYNVNKPAEKLKSSFTDGWIPLICCLIFISWSVVPVHIRKVVIYESQVKVRYFFDKRIYVYICVAWCTCAHGAAFTL